MPNKFSQEKLVNHFLTTGFIYQSSEIYGGLSNSWDFGPLGVLIKNNIKSLWWDYFVTRQTNVVGIDTNIILNSNVWKASGHIENFSDPLIDCKECKSRFRADKLIENFQKNNNLNFNISDQTEYDKLEKIISDNQINCPVCSKNNWTQIRDFNLLFKTSVGVIESKKSDLYLRPETAQGIFINFKNIQRTTRMKLPFGVAQIGKAFRNEITPGNFIFRTREFEQMEIEHFCHENSEKIIFDNYLQKIKNFLIEIIGIKESSLKIIDHLKEELAHYSLATSDFMFDFPHGWDELWGLANRGNYDLEVHEKSSKKSLEYLDVETREKFLPSVIEPSVGVERLIYAILINSYSEEVVDEKDTRIIMKLNYDLCPYKICILPLSNKLCKDADKIFKDVLKSNISATYDGSGSIGKRYRRQDAIGTNYCVTIDFETIKDSSITIRDRDTMEQIRISINEFLEDIHKLQFKFNK